MNYNKDENEEDNLSLDRFESMLKTNKVLFFDSEEFENIILHYLDSGKLTMAKKALQLGLEQHPNSVGLKLVEVEILIFQNKLEKAERLLNEIEAIEPENDEIYVQKASIQSKKGFHTEAIDSLKKALELTEDVADIYSLLGMEYLFIDEIEQARENFILCLENDEEDQSALYNVTYCYDFLGENNEAIDFLTSFIDRNPYSEIAWHQLGRQYLMLKNYEKAEWAFNYAILIDDQFLGAYLEKGKVLEKLGKYDDAIANYLITLELDDPTSYVLVRIGACYESLGKMELAIQYYKRAVHEDPMLDKGWVALANVYLKENNAEKAIFALQKALAIDEMNASYWIFYALVNKSILRFDETVKGYEKAAELEDVVLAYWLDWADVLYLLGEYDQAIAKLKEYLTINPEDAAALFRIAAIHFVKGDTIEGRTYLVFGLKCDAEQISVLKNLYASVWEDNLVQTIIKDFYTER
ncbi:MAG: tetratricopeptide repeat protein [Flavobacteriaceae bacterium]|jgi:tetratricopeptide (TPR) repeat protein|nr:tetratricopeptide repeat protein [Flavobacteriaceae bacterium]